MAVNNTKSDTENIESTTAEHGSSKIDWKHSELTRRLIVDFIYFHCFMKPTRQNLHSSLFCEYKAISGMKTSLGVRHLQVALLFTAVGISYSMRVNLSVAIVAMIDKDSANSYYDDFQWNEKTQSLLLSSFFWGYIVTQVPAGQMAEKYGPKFILLISTSICAIVTIITPICTSLGGWEAMCALRVIAGLCQGVIYPSVHTLLSKWAPPTERGPLGTYCYVGAEFGIVLMLGISGCLASSSMGWPSIFYFSGAVSLLWSIMWWWLGSNTPRDNTWISESEKDYIETSLKTTTDDNHVKLKTKHSTPWLSMFTSMPFLALTLAQAAQMWGYWTLITKLPSYMKHILNYDLNQNALFSALPYLAKFVMSFVFSYLAQLLDKRKYCSLVFSRKLFNSIGQWIPALVLIGLSYIPSSYAELAVAFLTIAVGVNAASYLGYQVNHIDLSPAFAGTMMGITNGVANIFSIIAPLIIGFIVTDETDPMQWRIIFFIAAGIYLIGNLMFVIFGKASVQMWNEPKKTNTMLPRP